MLIATQLMNLVFVPWIAHAGLALSIGLGACLNAGFLFIGLRRRGIYQARPGWGLFFAQLAGALFLLAGVTMWVAGHFDWIAMQSHPFLRMGALLLVTTVGALVYFGALMLTGFRFSDFKRIAR